MSTEANRPVVSESAPPAQLQRALRGRHIQLIAIGGAIGVGLFLGSAKAIQSAGPGLLLNYVIAGAAVFFIMRALGELLAHRPVSGALAALAREFVGPYCGYMTAWMYCLLWLGACMSELTAIGIYIHFWYPGVPQWVSALAVLLLLYGSNLLTVRVFGELEFWFALIKVLTIVAFLVVGTVIIVFGVSELGPTAGIANLWTHGGFFPFGVVGLLVTLQMVMFAYSGVEVVAMTAAEAENPRVCLPRAINGILYRIMIFYIGAVLVIMMLIPWNQLSATTSPFVIAFGKIGIPGAAHLINLVVITAAASSCNTGLYTIARMIHSQACGGYAPRVFAKLNSKHVPASAVHATAAVLLFAVVLNGIVPERVFILLTSVALVGTLWTWLMIMFAHLRYRRAVKEGRAERVGLRMPGAPVMNWVIIAFLLFVTAMLGISPDTRVALYVAPIWFGVATVAYVRASRRAGSDELSRGVATRTVL
jgi:AAT family amino acid transporter